tara:strand:- start:21322 stop:21774 length:453 start_codon:yes stop_codon:yes gene_type:complete
MNHNKPVHKAEALVALAYRNAPDELAHVHRVAGRLQGCHQTAVALLHDLVEDEYLNESQLLAVMGPTVTRSVMTLTRRKSETYKEYVRRVTASGDETAVAVKLADLYDHLDENRFHNLPTSMVDRYLQALSMLVPYGRGMMVRQEDPLVA